MSDAELRTLASEVVVGGVGGDTRVRIRREPDGRTFAWAITATLPDGLGPPGNRELLAHFVTERLAIQAATDVATKLHAARNLLRLANEQVQQARTELRDAESADENQPECCQGHDGSQP
jgi:hypothetical protein